MRREWPTRVTLQLAPRLTESGLVFRAALKSSGSFAAAQGKSGESFVAGTIRGQMTAVQADLCDTRFSKLAGSRRLQSPQRAADLAGVAYPRDGQMRRPWSRRRFKA